MLLQARQLYPRLHADLIAVAHEQGVTLHVTAEVMDLEALMALAAIGDAVTFVGENISDMAAQTSMTWRPTSLAEPSRARYAERTRARHTGRGWRDAGAEAC